VADRGPVDVAWLASLIDHTLLAPDATEEAIERLCAEARTHRFATVCVNGSHVARAAACLAGSAVGVCSVAGFPLGAMTRAAKVFEAQRALDDGAREIDAVLPLGALKAGDDATVIGELAELARTCHARGALLKVILECALLDDPTKRHAASLAVQAGADFVKTSTGFAGGGATVADVALLRSAVGQRVGVKASGGIRDLATARALLAAGANRLGTSASLAILREV
jgi:deoxyribose-phosphate aldolase